jgi:ribosome recycling factor
MYKIDQDIQKITDEIMIPVDKMGMDKEAELMQI